MGYKDILANIRGVYYIQWLPLSAHCKLLWHVYQVRDDNLLSLFCDSATELDCPRMLDTPVIGFSWLNLRLFLRLIIGGSLTASSWEMLDRIFDVLIPVVSLAKHA